MSPKVVKNGQGIFHISSFCILFPKFSTLELKHTKHGPQIRILREISSLEPAPIFWKPKSRSKNAGFDDFANLMLDRLSNKHKMEDLKG